MNKLDKLLLEGQVVQIWIMNHNLMTSMELYFKLQKICHQYLKDLIKQNFKQ